MTSTIESDRPTRIFGTSSLSTATESSYIAFKEPNGTVRVDFYLRASANIPTSTAIFTLPSGYRPSVSYGGVAIVITSANDAVVGSCTINANGQILMPVLTSNGRGISGHIEYFV